MDAFLPEPPRLPLLLRPGIWLAEKITGRRMLPARLMAWHPRTAIGSGVLEALTPHGRSVAQHRLLKLVRLKASLATACPFCLDMNSPDVRETGISQEELDALAREGGEDSVSSFSAAERAAISYAGAISATPLAVPQRLVEALREHFAPREVVMIASAAAQVNYWARLIQALGIPPAGFSSDCPLRLPALPLPPSEPSQPSR